MIERMLFQLDTVERKIKTPGFSLKKGSACFRVLLLFSLHGIYQFPAFGRLILF